MKQEKQVSLNPEMVKEGGELDISELQQIAHNINKNVFVDTSKNINGDNSIDTYFKNVIDKMFSDKDISLKTEYTNEDEQFCGTKLDFMAKKCGLNLAKTFLFNWEKKRVSLNRKSRQEVVYALWERQQEIKRQEEKQFQEKINM